MAENYTNWASTILTAAYVAGSGVLTVAHTAGDDVNYPFPVAPNFRVSINDQSTSPATRKLILKVVGITDATHFAVIAEGPDINVASFASCVASGALTAGALKDLVGAGPGLTLLNSINCAGPIAVDTTSFTALYDEYVLELVQLVFSSPAVFRIRCSTDGGATYDAGPNYNWAWTYVYPGAGGAIGLAAGDALNFREIVTTMSANGSLSGSIKFFGPATGINPQFLGQVITGASGADPLMTSGGGIYLSTTPVNALEFSTSVGTFVGVIRIYGVNK